MTERIKLTIPNLGVSAIAELVIEQAPDTVEAVKSALPFAGKATHGRWGGNEIWAPFPLAHKSLKKENIQIYAEPGQIFLVQNGDFWDVAIFYGKGWTYDPTGFLLGRHFATILPEYLANFAEAANKFLEVGSQEIEIETIGA